MTKFLSHFGKLWDAISSNVIFLLEFVGIIAVIFVIAYVVERAIKKRNNDTEKILTTRKVAVIGVMSAISGILMCFEIPLWFAPPFYKLDFSELPVLICGFAFGPVAGVLAEAVKILIKLILKGTSTAFVGDLANFVVGCSFILTATIIYHIKKNKKTAVISCIIGTLVMTVAGTAFNAVYLLPKFAEMYGMPMDVLIAMGTAVNKNVKNITTFVVLCVAPLNLLKGFAVSLVTILIYHPLRLILKKNN